MQERLNLVYVTLLVSIFGNLTYRSLVFNQTTLE